jgi:hypothetical protein
VATGLTARRRAGLAPRRLLLGIAAVAALAACTLPAHRPPTYPPAGVTPPPAAGRTDAARAAVIQAISVAGLPAGDGTQPYRPPEGAWFAAAPRTIVQVSVPNEPGPRFVVVYAFDSPADAASAAADQASYVSRGPGKVYFPGDTRFTIRVIGSVAVFFAWSPANGDPRTMAVETALGSIGDAVPIPN